MALETHPMRWAEPGDAERIAHYHHQCWHASFVSLVSNEVMQNIEPRVARWNEWLAADSAFTTVVAIDEDDRPIGHTTVSDDELCHLFIDPAHWGEGLGRALLRVGERLIRQGGHRQARLQTIVGNAPAISLYEASGWVVTDDTVVESFPNGASYVEHVLRKDIDAPSHVEANRDNWDDDAPNWVDRGRRSWGSEPHWGEMSIPESAVGALPELEGRAVVELGCGTGYVASWCLRAGAASAVGLDNSLGQLRSAQILQREFGRTFPLVWSDAEQTPFADNSFDVAINEYGAGLWCDPARWIPEAARVLRPGGSLLFLAWSTLMAMSAPPFEHQRTSTALLRSQRDLHKSIHFPDFDGVQFALSHGQWIELLTSNGFTVDRLIELYAPDDGPERYSYYDASWARQWPPEEMWCATLAS